MWNKKVIYYSDLEKDFKYLGPNNTKNFQIDCEIKHIWFFELYLPKGIPMVDNRRVWKEEVKFLHHCHRNLYMICTGFYLRL
jgi:hypothetical protein